MNLILIRQRYTPFGGAERFLEQAMQALGNRGIAVSLLTRHWPQNKDRLPFALIPCHPFHVGRLWRDLSFSRAACRYVRSHGLLEKQLVQSHERIPCCHLYRAGDGVHREWLKQRARILSPWQRAVVSVTPYHRYLLSAEQQLFTSPHLRKIICNSHMVSAEIERHYGVESEKRQVIYSGVDHRRFHPEYRRQQRKNYRQQWGIAEQEVLFLLIGSGFERKGLDLLLRIWPSLPPQARLMVIGKDRRLAHYQQRANQAGLQSRWFFMGGQEEVLPFYAAADAFVLPTLYDPFPNVVLEAMAMGLPVLTSFKSGASDLIVDGENGLLGDALDSLAFSMRLNRLLDADERIRIGKAGCETVAPLSMESMAQQMVELYRQFLFSDHL